MVFLFHLSGLIYNKRRMKLYKKDTPFTLTRDAVRLFFALNFYLLAKTLGIEFEFESEYVVLGSILILGPLFCGWFCPFGASSYIMTRIGRFLFPKLQFTIPQPFDSWLRNIKYLMLAGFLYLFISQGVNYFAEHMDMYKANAFSWNYIQLKHWAVLFIPLFIPGFFCKYMCFQKAGYNIINRLFTITKIKRNADTCIGCQKCDRVCPMEIKLSEHDVVSGEDCLGCYNCLDKDTCPEKIRALSLVMFGREINHVYFSIAAISLYLVATYLVLFVFKW